MEHAHSYRTQRRWIVGADGQPSLWPEFADAFARESAAYQDLLDVAAWITQFSPSNPSLHEAACIFRSFLARLHAAEKETTTLISSGLYLSYFSGNPAVNPPTGNPEHQDIISGNPAVNPPPAGSPAHQDISDLEINDLLMHTLYD